MAEELSAEQIQQISDSLASGSKIEAIKLYREFTGKDLKEAKDFVDALVPQLLQRDPQRYAKLQQAKGCAGMLLLGVVCGGLVLLA